MDAVGIDLASCRQRSESFVIVVMAVEDNIDSGRRQVAPYCAVDRVGTVRATGPPWLVPVGERTPVRMSRQIGQQPPFLW